jgi:DNA helicase-2/ATP-dependent DNA helicase PcrA
LRADAAALPRLTEIKPAGFTKFHEAMQAANRQAEDRLAYVAVTRARHRLIATTHCWQPGAAKPKTPSPYFLVLEAIAERSGTAAERPTDPGSVNPVANPTGGVDWPVNLSSAETAAWAEVAAQVNQYRAPTSTLQADLDQALAAAPVEVRQTVAAWEDAVAALTDQSARQSGQVTVTLPTDLTASQLIWARRDPQAFAAQLARPWPRSPSPGGRVGQAFHHWLETWAGRPTLVDAIDWADDDWEEVEADWATSQRPSESDRLAELQAAFQTGRFADRTPLVVEHGFTLAIAGFQLRGRIDAVYDRANAADLVPGDADYLVVDWKTGLRPSDPGQLALYRLAWARQLDIPPETVAAGFYHVADDRWEPVDLSVDESSLGRILENLASSAIGPARENQSGPHP